MAEESTLPPQTHELGRRIKAGEPVQEVLHDLYPPVVYIFFEDGRKFWATRHQCSIEDDIGRRCIREAGHRFECLIPVLQLSARIADK